MTKTYKQEEEIKVDEPILNQANFLREMIGVIDTVSTAPSATTSKPTKLIDQFKFYSSGGTYRLYIFDAKNSVWRYCALT